MADTTITGLPGGSTPLGPEKIVLDQSGRTVNLSLSDIFQQGGDETITSLNLNNGILSYEAEDGNTTDIDFNNLFTDSLSSDWDTNDPSGGNRLFIRWITNPHNSYDPYGEGNDVPFNSNYALDKDRFPLIITDDNDTTEGPNSHGIVLYNASGGAGTFAPSILFANREAETTDYRTAISGIYSRTVLAEGGNTGGSNFSDGELIFATSGVYTGTTTNSQGVTQRMVIDRAGRVGINVIAPTEVLDVDGNIKASGNVTAADPTADTHLATKSYVDNINISIESAYPVGSIYMNATNATNPATLLGFGTWVAFGAGRVPVGINSGDTDFDTAEETGGAKTHTLTESEMPAHTHRPMNGSGGSETNPLGSDTGFSGMDSRTNFISATNLIEETGGGQAHNNLQPYIVVHMWKRTA